MATKRQLAAIMFTDITGYSAMMEADEDYARKIRQRHRTVFRDAHEQHGGNILQYYGDGTLSMFESTAAAVECAVEMQIEYRKEPEVPLRIGIHTGDISYDEDGAYGDGLNIAARIERLCVPGGVYISAKVFDDIKNHKWLTAVSLGPFQLRNIQRPLEIFSVTSKGLAIPTEEEVMAYPEFRGVAKVREEEEIERVEQRVGNRKKGVAALLAFFFGMWGVHRFYLGQRAQAIAWLILSVVFLGVTVSGDADFPPIVILALLGFLDFILLLAMPKADFDYKYNKVGRPVSKRASKRYARRQRLEEKRRTKVEARGRPRPGESRQTRRLAKNRRTKLRTQVPRNPALAIGITKYRQGYYREALKQFNQALEIEPDSPVVYFNMACAHAQLEDAVSAYEALAQAVENGFDDYDRIAEHEALEFLRERRDFVNFVNNEYRIVEQLPRPRGDLLEEMNTFNPDILDKLENLGELLEKGALTQDEFDEQKRRILGSDQ